MSIERSEALAFLKQDPLVNATLISQVLHAEPLRVNVNRDERGIVNAVIVIEPLIQATESDVLVQMDARGPEEARALLRFLRGGDRIRLELHRPWLDDLFRQSSFWRPTGAVMHTLALHPQTPLPPPDPNIVQLTARHATHLANEPLSWAPSTLRRYLKEGKRAFAYQAQGRLVARAVSGLPTPNTEEITSVFVAPEHRRHGYGRAVVAALAHDIRAFGRVPTYVTTSENEGSLQLARGLSFKLLNTIHVYERLSPEGL